MKILLLFVLLFSWSCSRHTTLVGTWKSKDASLIQRGLTVLNGNIYLHDTELILYEDSSWFKNSTCMMYSGKSWETRNDTLFLYADSSGARGNSITMKSDYYVFTYKVRGDHLRFRAQARYLNPASGRDTSKYFTIVDQLEFIGTQ